MTDESDRIDRAKRTIACAHQELINAYTEQIREVYRVLSTKKKAGLLEGLEILLDATEMGESIRIGAGFDIVRARKLREKVGLKPVALARQLGIAPYYLCKYESGASNPAIKKSIKEPAKKYLAWLKEQGYEVELI